MVSRKHIASKHDSLVESDIEEPSIDLEITQDERRKLFGSLREDLYYKAIVRDVRKYVQDQFKSHLGLQTKAESIR